VVRLLQLKLPCLTFTAIFAAHLVLKVVGAEQRFTVQESNFACQSSKLAATGDSTKYKSLVPPIINELKGKSGAIPALSP